MLKRIPNVVIIICLFFSILFWVSLYKVNNYESKIQKPISINIKDVKKYPLKIVAISGKINNIARLSDTTIIDIEDLNCFFEKKYNNIISEYKKGDSININGKVNYDGSYLINCKVKR